MSDQTTVLDELVGEGKKFKTVEDLAKSKKEADAFVVSLTGEIAGVRDELKAALGRADKTDALETLLHKLTEKTTVTDQTTDPSQKIVVDQTKTLSQDDIVKIIEARERDALAARNAASAMAQLTKVYGEKTDEVLAQKAQKLGLSLDDIKLLASKSPQAFLNVLGATGGTASAGTSSMASAPSVHVSGDVPDANVRNKAFYEAKKKEMGTKAFVFDSKLQVQMHRDMASLGDAWYT